MAPTPRLTVNRRAVPLLARDARLGRHLENVADAAADEAQRRLPYPRILGGIRIEGTSTRTSDGHEGRVVIRGPGWHLWEYGTKNHGARPAIRPGVQVALSRFRGRWQAR